MTIKCLRKCCEFSNSCIYIGMWQAHIHTCVDILYEYQHTCKCVQLYIYIHCERVWECVCAVERQLTLLGVSKRYRCSVSVIVKQVKSATYFPCTYVFMYIHTYYYWHNRLDHICVCKSNVLLWFYSMPIQAPSWTDFLNCPICCNEFEASQRVPISLGCGHTICKPCLTTLYNRQCPYDQVRAIMSNSSNKFNYFLIV